MRKLHEVGCRRNYYVDVTIITITIIIIIEVYCRNIMILTAFHEHYSPHRVYVLKPRIPIIISLFITIVNIVTYII